MIRPAPTLTALALLLAVTACSSYQRVGAPPPQAAPPSAAVAAPTGQASLEGEWDVTLGGGGSSTMRLVARPGGYVGVLLPFEGVPALGEAPPAGYQVRSATVYPGRVTIVVDLDGDDGTIVAAFRGADVLDGTISSRHLSGRITLRRR